MDALLFIAGLFVFFVGGGWFIGKAIGSIFDSSSTDKYVDRSTTVIHHHHYHNTTNQSISIIDPDTKKKILELKNKKNK